MLFRSTYLSFAVGTQITDKQFILFKFVFLFPFVESISNRFHRLMSGCTKNLISIFNAIRTQFNLRRFEGMESAFCFASVSTVFATCIDNELINAKSTLGIERFVDHINFCLSHLVLFGIILKLTAVNRSQPSQSVVEVNRKCSSPSLSPFRTPPQKAEKAILFLMKIRKCLRRAIRIRANEKRNSHVFLIFVFWPFILWMKLLNKKIDRSVRQSCSCVLAARVCVCMCLHSRQNCRPLAATKFTVPATLVTAIQTNEMK